MFIFSRRPIIFSVSGKKIMAAKIINGQIKRRRLFWADLSCRCALGSLRSYLIILLAGTIIFMALLSFARPFLPPLRCGRGYLKNPFLFLIAAIIIFISFVSASLSFGRYKNKSRNYFLHF